MSPIEKLNNFDSWMLKINNIYYQDDNKMTRAYECILNYNKQDQII